MPREKALKSRSRLTTRSSLFSRKSVGPLLTESRAEAILAMLMDSTSTICYIKSQPEQFRITVDEETFRYTPDFLYERDNGDVVYAEVKDDRYFKKPKQVARLEMAQTSFEAAGMELRIFTDKELQKNQVLLTNLRHLQRYRAAAYKRLVPLDVTLLHPLPRTLGELKARMGPETSYRLISEELVWCDLTKELADCTPITEMEGRKHEFID